ncbi:formyltetrahydrofolate deformylase [Aquimarina agarilytica]|uniref:formyltetrahydrofolate deformylase n=1 Tax=Aquimarina agarilytica TaxID=1087449 RepID=UPI000288C578|nr:formyltetrahydrofolate deformylase [Aquimarina agarilytica]
MKKIILLIHCPDQQGIIAKVTNFIAQNNGNTVYLEQHVDTDEGAFFMRLECEFEKKTDAIEIFKTRFANEIASEFKMEWQLFDPAIKPKMGIFVSKYSHCLYDILGRYAAGELGVEIPVIISNHNDMEVVAKSFNIPFKHIPVTKTTKAAAETEQIKTLTDYGVDFVVLARYMQILSADFVDQFTHRVINIHHSFLPAFPGAKPYHSAHQRGVKIIGATSHYVTSDLDEGPIIEQEVVNVSHTHSIQDFIAKGRDVEKIVLSRAIKHHVDRKVLVYNNKTVVFD